MSARTIVGTSGRRGTGMRVDVIKPSSAPKVIVPRIKVTIER